MRTRTPRPAPRQRVRHVSRVEIVDRDVDRFRAELINATSCVSDRLGDNPAYRVARRGEVDIDTSLLLLARCWRGLTIGAGLAGDRAG